MSKCTWILVSILLLGQWARGTCSTCISLRLGEPMTMYFINFYINTSLRDAVSLVAVPLFIERMQGGMWEWNHNTLQAENHWFSLMLCSPRTTKGKKKCLWNKLCLQLRLISFHDIHMWIFIIVFSQNLFLCLCLSPFFMNIISLNLSRTIQPLTSASVRVQLTMLDKRTWKI